MKPSAHSEGQCAFGSSQADHIKQSAQDKVQSLVRYFCLLLCEGWGLALLLISNFGHLPPVRCCG